MSDATLDTRSPFAKTDTGQRQKRGLPGISSAILFVVLLAGGLGYAIYGLVSDMHETHAAPLAIGTLVLLGLALLIALGFEFVNGFHDTANAVATVIYTRSLAPPIAVVWSGFFNFLGVLTSSGAVAYSIITLLPIDLILNSGSTSGYPMIFALLLAAIIWNLATWAFGIPNSSSHALIGSILGVGLANQLMTPVGVVSSGVQWDQAFKVLKALIFSPLIGFVAAGGLLLLGKLLIRRPDLWKAPEGDKPPPLWIRGLLIVTCTGVSLSHGGNDGQKGMGLIMLILIGAAPTAFALNRAIPESNTPAFVEASKQAATIFQAHSNGSAAVDPGKSRGVVANALKTKQLDTPVVYAALASLSTDIATQIGSYGAIRRVPAEAVSNVRNDMYLAAEAVRTLPKAGAHFSASDDAVLKTYAGDLNHGTRFIPVWVKVSVAVALGLGTMVGWKRIVVTVGEKIGKTHMTYGQGAAAEIVAAVTIGLAEGYGLPVSTTHILSSGVAGAMAANGSGLQMRTLRNLGLAWVLTLPVAILLAGSLYWLLHFVF
ncbi:inorganic phosphate transporter [Lichenicola cladoniae]|uniref:Phosphate transporter n=1 Tax=Lichenicola cladoniae TaxID=1484109 RepID=A0A6M8HPE6_9PROT|nr:inorganic phosphate transporter [Lichenicola cladoniae]NPD66425.1 inorganic phosphate transporter [Acetobacteraceae bacterium]QKE90339.1 inorganic phosphate transporter [Lichenicola cladoniae]